MADFSKSRLFPHPAKAHPCMGPRGQHDFACELLGIVQRDTVDHRREGGQSWAVRNLPDGRGRGIGADVQGDLDADRPAAGAARSSMKGLCGRNTRARMGEVRLGEDK